MLDFQNVKGGEGRGWKELRWTRIPSKVTIFHITSCHRNRRKSQQECMGYQAWKITWLLFSRVCEMFVYPRVSNKSSIDFSFKCGRVSKSERIFVHKNLLMSLAFGQLVYILDMNIFPSRNLHHVSTENRQ